MIDLSGLISHHPGESAAHGVLLLLDLKNGAVLERPLDDVGLIRCALGPLALVEVRPELAEVLELDEVPDVAEWCLDDSRLADGRGSGNATRHDGFLGTIGCSGGVSVALFEISMGVGSKVEVEVSDGKQRGKMLVMASWVVGEGKGRATPPPHSMALASTFCQPPLTQPYTLHVP